MKKLPIEWPEEPSILAQTNDDFNPSEQNHWERVVESQGPFLNQGAQGGFEQNDPWSLLREFLRGGSAVKSDFQTHLSQKCPGFWPLPRGPQLLDRTPVDPYSSKAIVKR